MTQAAPVSAPMAAVSVRGLTKAYDGIAVLHLDCLDFAAGQVHVLTGPNGAGKTTLLRLIAGLESPDAGELLVLGSGWRGAARERLSLHRRLGLATQKPYLFGATVRRNVEYPLRSRGLSRAESAAKAERAMRRMGIFHLAGRRARTLSAGETQRTAIARAVVADPQVLLLDEPLANIDPESTHLIESACRELTDGGATVIVASHAHDLAYHLSARVTRLERGRLAFPSLENLLCGEVVTESGGGPVLALAGGLRLAVATDRRGPVHATVSPADIALAGRPSDVPESSCLLGRVVKLEDRGAAIQLTADVGVELVAATTILSVRELGITIGSEVYLMFKASALQVLPA